MRAINLLASAMHLLIVLLFLVIGLFFILIFINPSFLMFFLDYSSRDPIIFLKVGFIISTIGLVSLVSFYNIHKSQYIKLLVDDKSYKVNANIIQNYLQNYLEVIYPNKTKEINVFNNSKDQLEIVVNVNSLNNQKEFILDLEKDLKQYLSEKLNYKNDFFLTINCK